MEYLNNESTADGGYILPPVTSFDPPIESKLFTEAADTANRSLALIGSYRLAHYISLIIAGIQLAMIVNPIIGLYANVAGLALLMILALKSEKARKLAIVASILPIVTLVSISFAQASYVQQDFVYYDILMLLTVIYWLVFKLDKPTKLNKLSKRQAVMLGSFSAVLGAIAGIFGYLLMGSQFDFQSLTLPVALAAAIFFAVIEELYFRGLVQRLAGKVMSPLAAGILTVVLWTSMNLSGNVSSSLLFGLFSGTVLSGIYYLRNSIAYTIPANIMLKICYLLLSVRFFLH